MSDVQVMQPRVLFYDNFLHLIEYPPQTRLVRFNLDGRYEKRYLSFPFVQMGRFDMSGGNNKMVSLHVSFTNTPMKSMDQPVYLPMLPNCWSPTLQVCIYPKNPQFEHFVELFFGAWFTSTEKYLGWGNLSKAVFLNEEGQVQRLGPDDWKSTAYKEWEAHTKKDPTFSTRVNWPYPCSWQFINKDRLRMPGSSHTHEDKQWEIRDFATFRVK
jgi:hypothetical protein